MTSSSSNTCTSSKQALVEPVDVYFRALLPFGIVPPGFENCDPQVPAAEPWEEESYTAPRKQRISKRPPPVLTGKCSRDLLAMLSPSLPPTPASPWDGHDAVCADPAVVRLRYALEDVECEFECYRDCEDECTCERVDSVMKVEVANVPAEEFKAARCPSKEAPRCPSKDSVSASPSYTGHGAVLMDSACIHVEFSLPDAEDEDSVVKIEVSSLSQAEREARRSRSRSPGHAGFRSKAAQETFERELVDIPPPPARFLAEQRAKQD